MSHEILAVVKNNGLRYRYVPDAHCKNAKCSFSTLAEVGQIYQRWFLEEIKARGWVVRTDTNLKNPPWVQDYIYARLEPGKGTHEDHL